jgi:16S rRNA (adenine1518-N6/adenine1519-N6)-dimethyltransferase
MSSLLGAADVRTLAADLGIRPTKTLGQSFVHDANTVRRIVRTAQLSPGEHVLEIGPGLGSLTLGLLEAGLRVTAVEIDPVLAEALPATVRQRQPEALERLTVVRADALALESVDGAPTALVANLPYNTSVPIVLQLLELVPSLHTVLVMVQSEVAERLAAPPGSKIYGVPSVKVAWYAQASRAGSVPRSVFWPVPNVDSGLVRMRRHPIPTGADRQQVFAVIDAAFAQRRKMLRSALAGWAGSAAMAAEVLLAAAVDPTARGETLDVQGFVRIASAGNSIGIPAGRSAGSASSQAGEQQQHGGQSGDGHRD